MTGTTRGGERARPARPRRRWIAFAAALGLALVLAGVAHFAAGPAAATGTDAGLGEPRAEGDVRREKAAALAAESLAARTHDIYLALDPRGGHLDLKVDGLRLRRFEIERGLFGRPRFGSSRAALSAARFRLISELPEPDRPLIPIRSPNEGAGAGSSSLAVSEARAETMAQMPTHYRLLFQPPLEISVRGESLSAVPDEGALDRFWRLRFRIYEGWQALGHRLRGHPVPPRVVLFFAPDEARRLFMTLDPAMQLVIAAPAPPAAPESAALPAGAATSAHRPALPVPSGRTTRSHGAGGRAPG